VKILKMSASAAADALVDTFTVTLGTEQFSVAVTVADTQLGNPVLA
jgi:hypothetical protein